MNNVCPNCGITGPNFSCPNHTYCWGTGNTQSPTIQPQVTWMPVSDQLSNSSLFAEIGRLNILLNERNKEIERLKSLMPPDERGPGFVGQGSWSVFAEKVVAERDALREILAGLREKGIIDQHNRPLPLEGHHKDCGHGKDGWSLCTCEELKKHDPRQDLTVGDIVRFEVEGVITARQSAGIVKDHDGNDYEPIQYVTRESVSGKKSFVPCNQILTVIGKEE